MLFYDTIKYYMILHIYGLVQERCNYITNALELRFFALTHLCTNPSIYYSSCKETTQIRSLTHIQTPHTSPSQVFWRKLNLL